MNVICVGISLSPRASHRVRAELNHLTPQESQDMSIQSSIREPVRTEQELTAAEQLEVAWDSRHHVALVGLVRDPVSCSYA